MIHGPYNIKKIKYVFIETNNKLLSVTENTNFMLYSWLRQMIYRLLQWTTQTNTIGKNKAKKYLYLQLLNSRF